MKQVPMKWKKRPVVIEAMLFETVADGSVIAEWCGGTNERDPNIIEIPTLEGTMAASLGDYIIRGIKGEFYPCKPEIFAATYEAAE